MTFYNLSLLSIFIYSGFSISALISVFNRKIGYGLSAFISAIFLSYGLELHSIFGDFYVIASLVWFFSSIFSILYDNYGKWLAPLFIISILGMAIALTSNNYLEFLAGWEIMTIPAYGIMGLNKRIDFPAFVFMAFGELSTVLLLSGFVYAYMVTGSIEFVKLYTIVPLVVTTFGFMIKMGIFPFLVTEWLPLAHGNSPANASAILSASVTLIGVFGIVKMTLLSPISTTFGFILMSVGGFSVFFGALYAYISDHVKGLPAFSTIENNGAILASIGVFMTSPTSTIQQFALFVIVTFALAHSIAKTGLFLISGSVEGESLTAIRVTKNRLGEIGGILLTSSMSGLLPNVGGVATWGLLQSLFMESYALHSILSSVPIIVGSIIAMGEGFASGAMIKFISFTQIFKGNRGQNEKLIVPFVVGVLVLILGSLTYLLFPGFIGGVENLGMLNGFVLFAKITSSETFGGIAPFYVLILVIILSLVTLGIFGKPKVRRSEAWNNGIPPKEKYTAFAFANNIRLMLSKLLRTTISENQLETSTDIFWRAMYLLAKKYAKFSRAFARTYMNSSLSWYVIYMIIAFIIITILAVIL